MENSERLQKFLANSGVASRRKAEKLILNGKIKVNGNIVTELGTKIIPGVDKVEYLSKEVKSKIENVYVLLNKPINYVTTVKDQFGRNTVLDLVKGLGQNLLPVGRLDMYTSGALILTNDGDFIYHVTHPKHEVEKTYTVTLRGKILNEEIENLKNGVMIDNEYLTKPARVKILKIDEEKNICRLEIVIHEGRNRQIRKMCEAVGKKVIALHRSKIGNISVKNLKIGTWRYLTKKEIEELIK